VTVAAEDDRRVVRVHSGRRSQCGEAEKYGHHDQKSQRERPTDLQHHPVEVLWPGFSGPGQGSSDSPLKAAACHPYRSGVLSPSRRLSCRLPTVDIARSSRRDIGRSKEASESHAPTTLGGWPFSSVVAAERGSRPVDPEHTTGRVVAQVRDFLRVEVVPRRCAPSGANPDAVVGRRPVSPTGGRALGLSASEIHQPP
jgi:hypothetical protein